jgi:hypothetical protein
MAAAGSVRVVREHVVLQATLLVTLLLLLLLVVVVVVVLLLLQHCVNTGVVASQQQLQQRPRPRPLPQAMTGKTWLTVSHHLLQRSLL